MRNGDDPGGVMRNGQIAQMAPAGRSEFWHTGRAPFCSKMVERFRVEFPEPAWQQSCADVKPSDLEGRGQPRARCWTAAR